MAIFCLANDLKDLEERLGKIVVAQTRAREPVRAIDTEGLMAWAIGRECAELLCEHMMRERPEDFGGRGASTRKFSPR